MIDPLSFVFSLEAHHKIVGISDQECSTVESRLDRLLEPFVQDFVKKDVAYDRGYDAPYTKDNFEFRRLISFQRSPHKR